MFLVKSVRAKTLFSALVPMALVLVAVAIIALYAYERVARDVVQRRDTELARISAGRLSEGLRRYSQVLQSIAVEDDVQSMKPARLSSALENAQHQLYVFDAGVVVYDRKGVALWSQPLAAERQGTDFPSPSGFAEMRRTLRPAFSDIFKDEISGEDVILVGVPIVGQGGELKGVLAGVCTIEYSLLGATYAEVLEFKAGHSGYAYLVDGNGRVIYHRHSSQVGRDMAATAPVKRAARGETGAVLTEDATGETVISGFAPVPGTGWAVITQERWADIVGPIRSYSRLLLGLLVVGGVLSGALMLFSISRTLKPIKDLTHGAQRISEGDFDHTIAAKTGDEIQALAQQFNTMASALKESYTDLEQRVADRTKELEALYRADHELYRHLRLEQVLQTLVDVAVEILQADKSSVMVWDVQRERLVVRAARGFSPETMAQMSFALGEGVVGRVAATGEPIIVEDVYTDPRVARRITDPEDIRSFMHVPIEIGGEVFGVFNVDYAQPRALGAEEQRLFIGLAQRAALAIENARLYEQAQQAAVLEERQRLARDLHDAVTQTLFSASLIAEVLPRLWERNPEEGPRRLEELRQLTRGALAEMRTLLLELRPAALVETALGDLLRQLAESITGRARVPVTVTVEGVRSLPPEVQVALYRVAQEALNNLAKHAGASQARVSLHSQPEQVELRISDDGRGFDPEGISPESLGLGIMRERAEAIGAALRIESQIGQGTRITLVWPHTERREAP